MLEPETIVHLTYYDEEKQKQLYYMSVEAYDNGLLKVRPAVGFVMKRQEEAQDSEERARLRKFEEIEPTIFNLRSIGFLKVELVE